jgi:hypothetical protein
MNLLIILEVFLFYIIIVSIENLFYLLIIYIVFFKLKIFILFLFIFLLLFDRITRT